MTTVVHPPPARAASTDQAGAPESGAGLPQFRNFGDLDNLPAEPEWLWHGLLAPGTVTMLAGHPFAGKSMLVAALMRSLTDGTQFLGRTTSRTSAVLLTEEDNQVLRDRSDRFGLLSTSNALLGRSGGIFRHTWAEIVNAATEHALANDHGLLIIDTFSGLADLHSEQENDAGAITERLRLLQAAAGEGLAVLFLHHFNKVGSPRGSGAFSGVVDISIKLERPGKKSTIVLKAEGRFPTATPARLTAKLIKAADGWFYQTETTIQPVAVTDARTTDELLWDALVKAGPQGLSYSELDQLPPLSADKGKKRFPTWHEQGRLTRTGGGTKSDPYRFVANTAESVQCGEPYKEVMH